MRKTITLLAGMLFACISTATAQHARMFIPIDMVIDGMYHGLSSSHLFYQFEGDSLPAEHAYFEALAAYENKEYEQCAALIDSVLAAAEHPAAYYLLRGASHHQLYNKSLAFADFNTAATMAPRRAEAYHNLARLYLHQEDLVNAFRFVNTALQLGDEHPETVYLLGVIQVENKDYLNAMEVFKLYLEGADPLPKVYTQIALLHHKQNENEKALTAIEKALGFEEGRFIPYLLAGVIYREQKNKAKAIAIWQEAFSVLSGDDKKYIGYCLSDIYFEEKLYVEGIDYVLESFDIAYFYDDAATRAFRSSDHLPSVMELLYAYQQEKTNFDVKTRALICEALAKLLPVEAPDRSNISSLLQKAQKRYPDNSFLYFAMAVAQPYNDAGKTTDRYLKAIKHNPDYWPLVEDVVRFYIRSSEFEGDVSKVQPYFEGYINRILDRYPNRHGYRLFRAQFYYAQGRAEEAIDDYSAYINTSEDQDGTAELLRAMAYISLGENDMALQDYKVAYTAGIGFEQTRDLRNYASLLYESGDTMRAREVLNRELAKVPGDELLMELKGDWEFNAGLYKESMNSWLTAQKGVYGHPGWSIRSKLAEIYLKEGLVKQAREVAMVLQSELEGKDSDIEEMGLTRLKEECLARVYYVLATIYRMDGDEKSVAKIEQKAAARGYEHQEVILPSYY